MSETSPSTGKSSPVETTAAQLHHHEMRFLKALKMLIEAGKAKTVDDLIRYAEQDNQTESSNYLRAVSAERIPVDLAYDSLSVNLRMVAHKRNNKLLQDCRGRRVGLVLPLPPHVIDAFSSLMNVTVLQPDGHHVPLCVESRNVTLLEGSRAARQAVAELTALVFEAHQSGNSYLVDAEVADLVDPRITPKDSFLVVHLRPHQNPDDIELATGGREFHIL